ncbi:hypothetical protein [Demequina lignilytica]|uniref:Histidinol dehydrogenase n=1 Tax=Demequina lignilytica TaxID=3051663 RepID=A0AB35MGS4_9MICO|nr:hypothetical protein [Demequina sp. SYSU T0a273]MDN4482941.1 hypothetical protein [Demequina sp. SYSU T0a273]
MARIIGSYVVIALLGAIVALVGGGAHRSYGWVGLTLCVLLMGVASVFARTWRGFAGLGVLAGAWMLVTVPLAGEGPGGSALIAVDALGLGWVIGGSVAVVVAAFLPRSLLLGRDEAVWA